MKTEITIKKEVDVRYLKINAGVRHWQDSQVNGQEDFDIDEIDCAPKMPFAIEENGQYRWKPIIDVDKGQIVDWPKGTIADVHYKICDDGLYALLDKNRNVIIEVESYVPDCIGEYGDYIIMQINEDGLIKDFYFDEDDVEDIIENGF